MPFVTCGQKVRADVGPTRKRPVSTNTFSSNRAREQRKYMYLVTIVQVKIVTVLWLSRCILPELNLDWTRSPTPSLRGAIQRLRTTQSTQQSRERPGTLNLIL
ncbi:hypothetical protein PoB_003778700 [Plakobranchus ocellatus]|uniref:Uncharacterized protein n=1 Tax=Plakobranchus ocellatus TaxID=259542 RepID=A0AAV4AWG1_9GAST|nr:hypothetical protein PoB_003778700 [Plakobranchus ocellatus]